MYVIRYFLSHEAQVITSLRGEITGLKSYFSILPYYLFFLSLPELCNLPLPLFPTSYIFPFSNPRAHFPSPLHAPPSHTLTCPSITHINFLSLPFSCITLHSFMRHVKGNCLHFPPFYISFSLSFPLSPTYTTLLFHAYYLPLIHTSSSLLSLFPYFFPFPSLLFFSPLSRPSSFVPSLLSLLLPLLVCNSFPFLLFIFFLYSSIHTYVDMCFTPSCFQLLLLTGAKKAAASP